MKINRDKIKMQIRISHDLVYIPPFGVIFLLYILLLELVLLFPKKETTEDIISDLTKRPQP